MSWSHVTSRWSYRHGTHWWSVYSAAQTKVIRSHWKLNECAVQVTLVWTFRFTRIGLCRCTMLIRSDCRQSKLTSAHCALYFYTIRSDCQPDRIVFTLRLLRCYRENDERLTGNLVGLLLWKYSCMECDRIIILLKFWRPQDGMYKPSTMIAKIAVWDIDFNLDKKTELMLKIRATAVCNSYGYALLKHSPDESTTHVRSPFEPPFGELGVTYVLHL